MVLKLADQSVSRMNGSLESNCGYARMGAETRQAFSFSNDALISGVICSGSFSSAASTLPVRSVQGLATAE